MATTSIRTAAKRQLVALLGTDLPGIQVVYGVPGEPETSCVYVTGPTVGTVTYPVMMAGRLQRDDQFVLTVHMYVFLDGGSVEDAEKAAEGLFVAVENELAGATLGIDGEIETTLGPSVVGPNGYPTDDGGAEAHIAADVTVHARLN